MKITVAVAMVVFSTVSSQDCCDYNMEDCDSVLAVCMGTVDKDLCDANCCCGWIPGGSCFMNTYAEPTSCTDSDDSENPTASPCK
mmetsp:Transcript_12138/g.11701  ORF Transcript_12138/g.11701 Transcript_12138/m.11701 type:complete len:85 (+) Transcript_12138:1-255(+)